MTDYFAEKMGALVDQPDPLEPGDAAAPMPDQTADLAFTPTETQEDSSPSEQAPTAQEARPSEPIPSESSAQDPAEPSDGSEDPAPLTAHQEALERVQKSQSRQFFMLRQQEKRDRLRMIDERAPDPGKEPVKEEDPEAHADWSGRASRRQGLLQQDLQQEIASVQATFGQSARDFVTHHPEYEETIETGRVERVQFIQENYPGVTQQQAETHVAQEVAQFVLQAIDQGEDPATALFGFAETFLSSRGFAWEGQNGDSPVTDPKTVAKVEQRRLPHLSQLNSAGSGYAPEGVGSVTRETFYHRTDAASRLAIEHEYPDFMEALRIHGAAKMPQGLQDALQ